MKMWPKLSIQPGEGKPLYTKKAVLLISVIVFMVVYIAINFWDYHSWAARKVDGLVISHLLRMGARAVSEAYYETGQLPDSDNGYYPEALLPHLELHQPTRNYNLKFSSAAVFDPFTPPAVTKGVKDYEVTIDGKSYSYRAQPMRYIRGTAGFMLLSRGPDGDYDLLLDEEDSTALVIEKDNPIKGWERFAYDSSNGTVSSGDLYYIVPLEPLH